MESNAQSTGSEASGAQQRIIDGQPVLAEQPVPSALSRPDRPMYYRRVVELLLRDGTTVYACTECDYYDAGLGKARGHVTSRHGKPRKPWGSATTAKSRGTRADTTRQVNVSADWRGVTLGEAVTATQRAERLTADVQTWKARALLAERDLISIRRVIGKAVQ